MALLPILIAVSIVLYIYYKVAILKTSDSLTQVYFNAKARIWLGIFILTFGISQYIVYQTRLSLFIGIVFVILGLMQAIRGFRESRHYRNEWKRLNP